MVVLQGKRVRKRRKIILCITIILCAAVFALFLESRLVRADVENVSFTESARELRNPNRGFYHLYTFVVTDEETDYGKAVRAAFQNDTDTELMLVKICLLSYREGPVSEKGLSNIKKLLEALGTVEKQLILRFVYDDEGKGTENEPEELSVILKHMEQLGPVLKEHSGQLFILQGLFTGNWGEMNGTQYGSDEDMRLLANQLAAVTKDSAYLAVRTPAQWRGIIQSDDPAGEIASGNKLAARLSLFNDGLLGNESDYGTYKTEQGHGTDAAGRWGREEELSFQGDLCRYAPNGGEVINDNPHNDFENAVKGLAQRHITYLNKDYDQAVLKKWEKETVKEVGCFYGMDGYTYIERHLGYRLLIADSYLEYSRRKQRLSVEVSLKNAGFAPLYKEPEVHIIFRDEENGKLIKKEMPWDIKSLTGGENAEACQTALLEVMASELPTAEYTVYFSMEDPGTGKPILLANEQEKEEYGYRIGTVKLY